MKTLKYFLFFLLINLGSLTLGSWLMNGGPTSTWYTQLNQAPWTPPGWVFATAWITIMICFSIYLALLFSKTTSRKLTTAFALQVFLNIIWNFIFFNQHQIFIGFLTIILLAIVVYYLFFKFKNALKKYSYLLLPYMLWLLIAISLNGYILLYN